MAKIIHLDGQGREIVDEREVNVTHIVALNPGKYVRQDPSGRNLTRVDKVNLAKELWNKNRSGNTGFL